MSSLLSFEFKFEELFEEGSVVIKYFKMQLARTQSQVEFASDFIL